MALPRLLALGVFASFFLVIIALFFGLIRGISTTRRVVSKGQTFTFVCLTLASFAHTWFYMFKFMGWSFHDFERSSSVAKGPILDRVGNWVMNTGLFEQAWAIVCREPINWWWSEQLCLYTVGAWTVFVATQGRRHHVQHLWAYMLLGQLVAISVASNLFYVALTMSPADRSPPQPTTRTWAALSAPVLLSLVTVALSPLTSENTFLLNLLVMHALIFLPLLRFRSLERHESRISIKTFYTIILIACLAIRSRTILNAAAATQQQSPFGLLSTAWKTLHSHPAQSSIGWDIIWTSVSFIVWVALRPAGDDTKGKLEDVPYLILTTPLVSVGLTAPYILREDAPSTPVEMKKDN